MCDLLSTSSHFLISLCCRFVSAPSSLSLALPLCLQAIFLSVDRAQEIIVWRGRETPRALWPRLAAINPHFFFFFLGVGGEFSHLDPIASSVHLGLRNKPADTLDDGNTHQTQTQPLLAHLGGQERTHAAAWDRASDSDLIHVTAQHRATTMGRSVTKTLSVETSSSSNFIKNEPKLWKHWSCAVDRNDVNIAFFHR